MDSTNISGVSALSILAAAIVFILLNVLAYWKVFNKAGRSGWLSVIPFVNYYVLFRIAGRSGFMFLLLFIPFVNIIALIMLSLDLAKAFGKSGVFGFFGLFLFHYIGYLILGFGSAEYKLKSE